MTTRPVALVTGTSSGIGLWTAVDLARSGMHVVATMRDPARADQLRSAAATDGVEVDVRTLDVTDREAAARLVSELLSEYGQIGALVNNAGQGSMGTLEQLDDDALQSQLDVNYLAVAALTRLVLPGMRAVGRGRIVTVTSVGGVIGQPFADAYCAAKFAVEGLMQSLAPVAARFGVQVSVVEPAAVASDFVSNLGPSALVTDSEDPYTQLRSAYLARTGRAFAAAQHPRDAAAVVVDAVTTSHPRFRWQTSEAASAFARLSLTDLDGEQVLGQTATWLV